MTRIFRSMFSAMVKGVVLIKDRINANKMHRGLKAARRSPARRVVTFLFVVSILALLLIVISPARHTIASLVRNSTSPSSWTTSNNMAARLYRSLATKFGKTDKVGSPQGAGNAAATGALPVMPNMVPPPPLPPEPPPLFTDDPIQVGVTVVQALHITQLRTAVDQVRASAGLPAASWDPTYPAASGYAIKADHILELRTKLNEARTALGLPAATYSPPAPANGGGIRAAHVQELRDVVKVMLGTAASTDSTVARLDPANQTGGGGENPLSRNYNWSVPLVSLPGRNGLDLGLSLSYNSLVWTKHGSSISFDDDKGFPSPGFRLGFPVVQSLYYNAAVGKYAFLLITPDGARTELRQVNASTLYEAADSSHLLFNTTTMVLRTTDGTQLKYAWKGSEYQCTEIKDRNGNFITITYTSFDRIDTVVDTLNRTIKFNYNAADNNSLTSITQTWAGQTEPHVWASFTYVLNEVHTNFVNVTNLGPANGSFIKTLRTVTLNDQSRYEFEHTYWLQTWKINNYAVDGHLLNYHGYNLPGNWVTALDDCPRFTARFDKAENWNRDLPLGSAGLPSGPELEATTTTWVAAATASWNLPDGTAQSGLVAQITQPADGTYNKIYFADSTAGVYTGWSRGLASMVETYGKTDPAQGGNAIKQRSSVTKWIQDNLTATYILNPRLAETNVYDFNSGGQVQNRARTTIGYETVPIGDGTSCELPRDVTEFQANATTPLRRRHMEYNKTMPYMSLRIIGLASEQTLYQVDPNTLAETLMSKVGFTYDGQDSLLGADQPVQHDNTNYGAGFISGRANLRMVTRYDVISSGSTSNSMKYNTAGSVVSSTDASQHTLAISYADAFAANGTTLDAARPFTTLAYPTTITDPDGFASNVRYSYDFGAATWKQTPPPNTNLTPPQTKLAYDSFGRLQRVSNLVNNAYTRYEYPSSQNRVDTYMTIEAGKGEARSFSIVDGYGRAIASASDHPGSTGGFSGQLLLYDKLGRAIKTSNPTETYASGTPSQWAVAGDDDPTPPNGGLGWLYTQQSYDWKGRPLVTTNTDLTTKTASYAGCGCAGGEVVTLTDEGTINAGVSKRRQQINYADILGRTVKTEVLNWEGGNVYSATVNEYNARDQVSNVKRYAGAAASDGSCPTATCQQTTMTYDGYGRLRTQHRPEQNTGTVTTWDYNLDDTTQKITDARGASQTFGYNARRLVTDITYAAPGGSGITVPVPVNIAYDAAGNRISMSDGLGSIVYSYDQLSRLTGETRSFPVGNYSISYGYNLAGKLTSLIDPLGASFTYERDPQGRLKTLTGSPYANVTDYVTDVKYRAWGKPKSVSYRDAGSTIAYNARMEPAQFRLTANGTGASIIRENYSYFADGRAAQLTDLDDTPGTNPPTTLRFLSRAYIYDQVGRVTMGYGTGGGGQGVPYSQSYSYDAYGNTTGRSGVYYSYNNNPYSFDSASYPNGDNRRSGWTYNADGQVIATPSSSTDSPRNMSYDATGRLRTSIEFGQFNTTTYTAGYDGDGQLVNESSTTSSVIDTSYIVRSTVLGGEVLTRLDQSGNKKTTHVPAEGLLFATQSTVGGNWVLATYRNPLGITETGKAVYDPLGNYIPFQQWIDPRPPVGSYNSSSMGGLSASQADPNSYSVGCIMDGLPTSCNRVMNAINRGQAKTVTIGGTQNPNVVLANAGFIPQVHSQKVLPHPSDPPDELDAVAFDVDVLDYAHIAPGGQGGPEQNHPHEPTGGKAGEKKQKESKECAEHRARVLGDPRNKAALADAWTRSQVGPVTTAHEEGGLLGSVIDYGQSYQKDRRINAVFSVPQNVPSISLDGFREWAKQQIAHDANVVSYSYTYHTHPHSTGDVIPGKGFNAPPITIGDVNLPSGGDAFVSNQLHLPGIIVNKTHIVIYNGSTILCTFDR